MSQLEFKKVKDEFGDDLLILFERGDFTGPLAILDKFAMARLNKEWSETKL